MTRRRQRRTREAQNVAHAICRDCSWCATGDDTSVRPYIGRHVTGTGHDVAVRRIPLEHVFVRGDEHAPVDDVTDTVDDAAGVTR